MSKALTSVAGKMISIAAILLISGLLGLYAGRAGITSDHQESPTVLGRPGADITDVYMFPASDPSSIVLAMDIHALIPRGMSGGYYFDPDVMYQFKINTDGSDKEKPRHTVPCGRRPRKPDLDLHGAGAPSAEGTQSTWVGTP